MLISTKGRYALRVLIDLAEQPEGRYVPLKEVAGRQEISEKYLEGILKSLVRGGILSGLRGKGGGYKLAVAPKDCTVGAVLRLTEEGLAPVACLGSGSAPCGRLDQCRTIALWRGLDKLIQDYLDRVTLADLAKPCANETAEQL